MWGLNGQKKSSLVEDENFTFLGKGVDFKGVVNFDGTVRIDGRLEGEVHTKGTLIIGEHAVIKGVVTAGTLICGGKIQANITAIEKVQLLKTAILIGDVRSPSFSMEEGAHFQGMCDMGVDKWADQERAAERENVHDLVAHRGKVRLQETS
ncbi:MAG: polymer-forming cytoskeletal protein [Nitrospirota bacterium]|jgi:cytoskeletal protein CcmA (bactofilin family)